MKIAIASDLHWSQYSSIVRKRGEKYSVRLENLIESANWFYRLAEEKQCFATFILGDFFDKAELNSEEISALKEIRWASMPNYFIAGNHEMGIADHSYSSAKLFNLLDNGNVITTPTQLKIGNLEICILPYILESNRAPLETYFEKDKFHDKFGLPIPRLLLSHNDIAGIPMGAFISQQGFSIEEIEANCDKCINGHLHNGMRISPKIINIGNLTGQNFSEDANIYDHTAFVVDTDDLKIEVYENPYALNFYKIDVTHLVGLGELQLKSNAICSIKCKERDKDLVKDWVAHTPNVVESRINIEPEVIGLTEEQAREVLSINHLERFKQYIVEQLGNNDIINYELNEVCK